MRRIRRSVAPLALTTLLFATLLASGCALFSGRDGETDPVAADSLAPDRSYGVLQTGSYLIRHPDAWRFVAVDPASSRGIVLFGRDPEGTLEYSVEETDFESEISDEDMEALYLSELDRLGARYEVLYFETNLDVTPVILVEHGDARIIAVLLVSGRRVTIATLTGTDETLELDDGAARRVLDWITPTSDPTVTRLNASLPHLHAPDARWRWVSDTVRGFTVAGQILGIPVIVRVESAARWGDARSTAAGTDGPLFYTGAAVYRANVVVAERRLTALTLVGDDHGYEIEIRPADPSAPALPNVESMLASSALRELIGLYLILDEREVPS